MTDLQQQEQQEQQKIFKLDKQESKLLQFVQTACSDDDARPVLQKICMNGGIAAADGFRLHVIENTGNEEFDALEGVAGINKLRAGENYIEPTFVDYEQTQFPEYRQICPKTDNGVLIGIDPRFLGDVCKYADKDTPLYILIQGPNKPIEIKGTCQGQDMYALIMPMHVTLDDYREKYQPQETVIIQTENIVDTLRNEIASNED